MSDTVTISLNKTWLRPMVGVLGLAGTIFAGGRLIWLSYSESVKYPILHDPLFSGGLIALAVAMLTSFYNLIKGFRFEAILEPRWPILSNDEFMSQFYTDGSFKVNNDKRILVKGEGTRESSEAKYKIALKCPFSASVLIKPSPRDVSGHWRAGFVIREEGSNQDKAVLHLDCDNLVVAYNMLPPNQFSTMTLRFPAITNLYADWTLLSIQVAETGYTDAEGKQRIASVLGCVNQQSFLIGDIKVDKPLYLYLRVWSDNEKNHQVLIRDMCLSRERKS